MVKIKLKKPTSTGGLSSLTEIHNDIVARLEDDLWAKLLRLLSNAVTSIHDRIYIANTTVFIGKKHEELYIDKGEMFSLREIDCEKLTNNRYKPTEYIGVFSVHRKHTAIFFMKKEVRKMVSSAEMFPVEEVFKLYKEREDTIPSNLYDR